MGQLDPVRMMYRWPDFTTRCRMASSEPVDFPRPNRDEERRRPTRTRPEF